MLFAAHFLYFAPYTGKNYSANKNKVKEDKTVTRDDLLNGKYVLVQKGKKNYYIVKFV